MVGSLGGWGELLLKVHVWLPAIELATSCYCLWTQNVLGCMNRAWKAGSQRHIHCKKTARIFCFRDNCGLYCNACNPEFLAVCPSIHLLGLKLSQSYGSLFELNLVYVDKTKHELDTSPDVKLT